MKNALIADAKTSQAQTGLPKPSDDKSNQDASCEKVTGRKPRRPSSSHRTMTNTIVKSCNLGDCCKPRRESPSHQTRGELPELRRRRNVASPDEPPQAIRQKEKKWENESQNCCKPRRESPSHQTKHGFNAQSYTEVLQAQTGVHKPSDAHTTAAFVIGTVMSQAQTGVRKPSDLPIYRFYLKRIDWSQAQTGIRKPSDQNL